MAAALPRHLHRARPRRAALRAALRRGDRAGARPSRRSPGCRRAARAWGAARSRFSLWRGAAVATALAVHLRALPGALRARRDSTRRTGTRALRFAFLTRAALDLLPAPGLGAAESSTATTGTPRSRRSICKHALRLGPALRATRKTVLTIHNVGYQGVFPADALDDLGLAPRAPPLWQEDLRPGAQLPEDGHRLRRPAHHRQPDLRRRRSRRPSTASGSTRCCASGAARWSASSTASTPSEWDPASDPHLPAPLLRATTSAARRAASAALLGEARARRLARVRPLVGIVSRLTDQKGFDLLFDVLPPLLAADDDPASWRWAAARRKLRRVPPLAGRRASPAAPRSRTATATRWRTGSRPAPTSSSCRRATSPAG